MAIPFDHTQKALDSDLIIGNATSTVTVPSGPHTEMEVWRSWIDPGFSGTFEFLEATPRFRAYAQGGDASAAITWKWQLRCEGQSTWTDLHSAVSSTISANTEYTKHVVFDAVPTTAQDVPLELRLTCTTSDTDDELVFIFSSVTASATVVRAVGTSA